MIKQQIDKVLEAEMDRKDFLKHVGLAIVAIMGISAALQAFEKFGRPSQHDNESFGGYGDTPYGR